MDFSVNAVFLVCKLLWAEEHDEMLLKDCLVMQANNHIKRVL